MANPENKSNEATSAAQDHAGFRDDGVRRFGRLAGEAKDASPFGEAAPSEARGLKARGREADVKDAVEPPRNSGPDMAGAAKKSRLRPVMFALLPLSLVIGAYWY